MKAEHMADIPSTPEQGPFALLPWGVLLHAITTLEGDVEREMVARLRLDRGLLLRAYGAVRTLRSRWLNRLQSDLWRWSNDSNQSLDEDGFNAEGRKLYDTDLAHLNAVVEKTKQALAMAP